MKDTSPIKTVRTFEAVCDRIREEILSGNLKPGDKLPPERELAETLGVSRSAVREAARSLEYSGLIRCMPGSKGGAFVRNGDIGTVTQAINDLRVLRQTPLRDVTDMRIKLTETAIDWMALHSTPEDLDRLEADIAEIEDLTRNQVTSNRSQYIVQFYILLAKAAHNDILVYMSSALSQIVVDMLDSYRLPVSTKTTVTRRKVLELIRAERYEEAKQQMRDHLMRIHDMLDKAMKQ